MAKKELEKKTGYKKTKLGWIPEDWEVVKLKHLAQLNKKSLSESTDDSFSFRYIDLASVDKGKVIIPNERVLFKDAPSRARRLFSQNDILMSMVRPYLQGFAIVNFVVEDVICSTGFAVITVNKNCDANFVYQNLYSFNMMQQYNRLVVGSNYPALNTNDVENLLIPYTQNKDEQQKITEILSTWDDGIEGLEKLIEQKKLQHKALTQKLFRRANSKFELNECKLGQIFKNRKENDCCELELLSVCDGLGIIPRSKLNIKDSSNEDKTKYLKVCKGDIVYNTMRMWQGRCGVSNYEGIVSPAYTVCIPQSNINVDFMYYLFKTSHMIHDFWRYSQGIVDDTLNLKYNNFAVIKVKIPKLAIQNKIANLLKICDEEIKTLNSKLEKLKEQKKGLMQKLLTGQIRVKV